MMSELIIVLLLIALSFIFMLVMKNSQQIKYNKNLINSVPDIVLIYKNSSLIETNRAFFDYFSNYSSIEEFVKENGSISHFFEAQIGYLNPMALDGSSWFEHVKQVKAAELKIKIEQKEYYFALRASLLEKNITILVLSNITQLVKSKEEIKNLTLIDSETKISNRTYFDTKIKEEVAVSQRYKHPLSILMLEIDNFTQLQEIHGEIVASKLQSVYAQLILSHLRQIDVFCRFSGSKFIIILPSTDLSGARQVAQKIRTLVSSSQKILPITMSFGIGTYKAGDEITLFLSKADKALMSAKASGINKIVIG